MAVSFYLYCAMPRFTWSLNTNAYTQVLHEYRNSYIVRFEISYSEVLPYLGAYYLVFSLAVHQMLELRILVKADTNGI